MDEFASGTKAFDCDILVIGRAMAGCMANCKGKIGTQRKRWCD